MGRGNYTDDPRGDGFCGDEANGMSGEVALDRFEELSRAGRRDAAANLEAELRGPDGE